ncbi:NAD(P)-binding protein [Plectosphaerella plurivora]|uniref:NAD(P)-binding protein n=1 Tax=Plectosphaerella plurivora TaxID=936078 RepID=A0A9P9AAF4_9PEZI|nr:NAD(P)-binding protein [Plectosphaerella plurivora]
MLVLVAGATGHIGQHLIDALHSRGHQVRALARNLSSLSPAHQSKLHSSVQSTSYYDIAALDQACNGADAIIVAYSGSPELVIEGHLLLIRAAERAGIKRFIASSWCYDFRSLTLGQHDSYDPYIMLQRHLEMSSSIKPTFILSGVLAEVFFSVPGRVSFSTQAHGIWDPQAKGMEIWGTGDEVWHWTTEKDAAEFAADIIGREDAEKGGFWEVCSGAGTSWEIAAEYESVRGRKVNVQVKGTIGELRANALEARSQGSVQNMWGYIGWFYNLYTVDGTWVLKNLDNEKLGTRRTTLEEFLVENPEV